MFEQTVFIFGFIWMLTGICSLLLGPFVGFDRVKVQCQLREFYMAQELSVVRESLRVAIFWIAYLGFLLPATRPLIGMSIGLLLLVILAHLVF